MSYVLDASAVLAYLHREAGYDEVSEILAGSRISCVNWSEVAQKIRQKGLDATNVRGLLRELGLRFAPFTVPQAEIAADLWDQTRRHGLSLADRACLAFAMELDETVFTTDTVWGKLKLEFDIRLLR